MEIRSIATIDELSTAIAFFEQVFHTHRQLLTDENSPYAYAAWERRFLEDPYLLVTAFDNGDVVGAIWGRVDNASVTVGPVAVAQDYRGQGIGFSLLHELEDRCRKRGIDFLCLGSREEAEGFYLKCGYQPNLLIQAKKPVTLDELRRENAVYAEEWTFEDEVDVRLCLRTPAIDKQLERHYDETFPGCSTQTFFVKSLGDA